MFPASWKPDPGYKLMKNVAITWFIILSALPAAGAQADIRSVDFKNFTYTALCAGEKAQKITVTNGEFSKEMQMDGYIDRMYFRVFDASYGDLNGDGKDEAIIIGVCNTGGTGNFSEGFIYAEKVGKPILIARIPGGDRAYGGLRSAKVENGILIVESNDPGTNGASCCPEVAVTSRYKLRGSRIVAFGKSGRRELFPTERIKFARGMSQTTFDVTIPPEEGRRYIVGARAGQTLKVSTNSAKVSLRLLDDAPVTEVVNGFTARLPRSGDYAIEIQNNAETDVPVKVTIKIQ